MLNTLPEKFNETAEFVKMKSWATAWFDEIKANQSRKVAVVKTLRNSPTYKGIDDETVWSMFEGLITRSLNEATSGTGNSLKISFVDGEVHDVHGNPGGFQGTLGSCNGSLTLSRKIWSESNDERNNLVLIHELGHWWDWLLGCYGRSGGSEDTEYKTQGFASITNKEQNRILSELFSDKDTQYLLFQARDFPKTNFHKLKKDLTEATYQQAKEAGVYYIYGCDKVGTSLQHARSSAERRGYFEEWQNGKVFTKSMWNDLKRAKRAIKKFDWKNSTCRQARRLRKRVDRLSGQTTKIPFRFGGLIYLNPDLEDFATLANGLAGAGKRKVEQQDLDGDDRRRPDDQGTSFASTINDLIKLANALDSIGLSSKADRIDGIIKMITDEPKD